MRTLYKSQNEHKKISGRGFTQISASYTPNAPVPVSSIPHLLPETRIAPLSSAVNLRKLFSLPIVTAFLCIFHRRGKDTELSRLLDQLCFFLVHFFFLCNKYSQSEWFWWVHHEPHLGSVKRRNTPLAEIRLSALPRFRYFFRISRLLVLLPFSRQRDSFSISPA